MPHAHAKVVKLVRPDLEHDNAPLPRAGSKQDQDAKAKKAKEKTPAQKAEEEIAAAREAAGAEDPGAVAPKAAENKRLPKGTCKATNPELKKKGDATAQDHWNTWCDENCIPEKWGGIGENACKDGSMTGTVMCVCKQGVTPVHDKRAQDVPPPTKPDKDGVAPMAAAPMAAAPMASTSKTENELENRAKEAEQKAQKEIEKAEKENQEREEALEKAAKEADEKEDAALKKRADEADERAKAADAKAEKAAPTGAPMTAPMGAPTLTPFDNATEVADMCRKDNICRCKIFGDVCPPGLTTDATSKYPRHDANHYCKVYRLCGNDLPNHLRDPTKAVPTAAPIAAIATQTRARRVRGDRAGAA